MGMKVVYCCYSGAHTSITCAAIHTGILGEQATAADILHVPGFDELETQEMGSLRYMGYAAVRCGCCGAAVRPDVAVYAMSLGTQRRVAIWDLYAALGEQAEEWCFVDALFTLHPLTFLGGLLSRRMGVVAARPLAAMGIHGNYAVLVRLVRSVQAWLAGEQGGF